MAAWKVVAAVVLTLTLTALAVWQIRRRPWLVVGWLWMLGMLVPVLGLVQVGAQAMADRYLYLPLVGAALVVAWTVPARNPAAGAGAAIVVLLLAAGSRVQVGYWKDSPTLFAHAIEAAPRNWLAEVNTGVYLTRRGRDAEAMAHYRQALLYKPDDLEAITNLGNALLRTGNLVAATAQYEEALRVAPLRPAVWFGLGTARFRAGDLTAAERYLREAIRLLPRYAEAHNNLGLVLAETGRDEEALTQLSEAMRLGMNPAAVNLGMAIIFHRAGRFDEAAARYREVLAVRPDDPRARDGLDRALAGRGTGW
jgi:Flp pilus assembly protein TadD